MNVGGASAARQRQQQRAPTRWPAALIEPLEQRPAPPAPPAPLRPGLGAGAGARPWPPTYYYIILCYTFMLYLIMRAAGGPRPRSAADPPNLPDHSLPRPLAVYG